MPYERINTYCRMCGEQCSIEVFLDTGKIVKIQGQKNHPWNQGTICVKGLAAMDWIYAPDRITKPLKKTRQGWKEIPLTTALSEIADKMNELKNNYGARSMGFWKGEAIGFAQQEEYARRFCHAFGTPNYFSCDSECFCGHYIGYSLVDGTYPVPDFDNTSCMLLWGTNPPLSRPVIAQKAAAARNRGARLIVIDPMVTEASRQADWHVQLKPATDGAFALGMINLILEKKWYDEEFVKSFTIGFEELSAYAKEFTPPRVERETGVPISVLWQVTREFAEHAPQALNYVGIGLEHHENSINNIRAIASIGALCGCIDQKGGELLPQRAGLPSLTLYDEIPLRHLEPIGAQQFPVLYDFRQECHTMTAMDTMLTGKPYPLKGLIMTAANPVLTNPNSLKVKQALGNLELLVVRDLFMTETAELADYFLPAASFLERTELIVNSHIRQIGLRRKVTDFALCQSEYDFWKALADQLHLQDYFPWKDEVEVNQWLLSQAAISYDQLANSPEGIEYSEAEYLKYRTLGFQTPSGKVEFVSSYLRKYGYDELPIYRQPLYMEEKNQEYPYVLITGSRRRGTCNSRYHNLPKLKVLTPGPEVEMNTSDAETLGLRSGDIVQISSFVGSIELPVRVLGFSEVLEGTVQITHGWQEGNVNIITADLINDPIDGFPLLKSLPVKIVKKETQ
ncbi:molybdopterin-dependent oxidoreductase [Desulfosporosinus sp. FKA]|uniref:molybdopterin-containing oxidoreductase family protein n=1 Tax=Desulfosporosinus sp. FKA TaxID=1969834 RepID=UPI000B49907E|nr:molybdopterin-dependent oxidoreductase [Desulfosporosinus sp. FKA]